MAVKKISGIVCDMIRYRCQRMNSVSQKTREWIDFIIAMAAWAVSIFVVFKLVRILFSSLSSI
jgi:hypothetical protein